MRDPQREVVITGAGVCCHMGDDLQTIEAALRQGRTTPFTKWGPAVEHNCRCQLIGIYPGSLDGAELGVAKEFTRFMGRGSLLALKAARKALAQSGISPRELAVVVGSGAGDIQTHREIEHKLSETK